MTIELAKAKQILVGGANPENLQDYLDITLEASIGSKVDKDGTKVLSDENYTSAEKTKLSDLPTASEISSGLQGKVDTEAGKGLIDPAPVDGKQYSRKDDAWVEVTGDVEEAPIDGKQYARKDASWEEVAAGGDVEEAPEDGKTYGRKAAEWTEVVSVPVITEDTDYVVHNSTELQAKVSELSGSKQGLTALGAPARVRILLPETFVFNSTVVFTADNSWYEITRETSYGVLEVTAPIGYLFQGTNTALPKIDVLFSAPNTSYGLSLVGGSVRFGDGGGLGGGITNCSGHLMTTQNSNIIAIGTTFAGGTVFVDGGDLYLNDIKIGDFTSNGKSCRMELIGASGVVSIRQGGAGGDVPSQQSRLTVTGGKIACFGTADLSNVTVSSGGEIRIPSNSTATLSQLPNEITSAGIIFK